MDFTLSWMLLFGLSNILVVNLTNLTSHAFSKANMVFDPIERRCHYEVPDPGPFPLRYRRQELKTGTFLSFYSVLIIFAFAVSAIFAFIYCNHWWQPFIPYVISSIISSWYSSKFPLRLQSVRYYITQLLTPLCVIATYIVLINNPA